MPIVAVYLTLFQSAKLKPTAHSHKKSSKMIRRKFVFFFYRTGTKRAFIHIKYNRFFIRYCGNKIYYRLAIYTLHYMRMHNFFFAIFTKQFAILFYRVNIAKYNCFAFGITAFSKFYIFFINF